MEFRIESREVCKEEREDNGEQESRIVVLCIRNFSVRFSGFVGSSVICVCWELVRAV